MISIKMKKSKLFTFVILFSMVVACNKKPNTNQEISSKQDSVSVESSLHSEEEDTPPDGPGTLREIKRERTTDSIISKSTEFFIKNSDFKSIKLLDSLAKISDGSLSTDISIATRELFYKNFKGFIEFLYANPKSSLLQRFTDGMSEELAVYDGEERQLKIKELKDWAKVKSKEEAFSDSKINFVDKLLNEIDPSIFD